MLAYQSIEAWWWPYVFIAVAGWLATDMWRWLGVLAGNRLKEDSASMVWVRSVATALVAAVIAKLILYPSGDLAQAPLLLRIGSAAAGFAAFIFLGKRTWVGILAAIACLVGGQIVLG